MWIRSDATATAVSLSQTWVKVGTRAKFWDFWQLISGLFVILPQLKAVLLKQTWAEVELERNFAS